MSRRRGVLPDRVSDFTQGGYSDELTAVERYTVRDNPRRLENAFDEQYPALRGFRPADFDDGSGTFLAMLQGAPRTVRVSFRQSF